MNKHIEKLVMEAVTGGLILGVGGALIMCAPFGPSCLLWLGAVAFLIGLVMSLMSIRQATHTDKQRA
mgnify:CR=1 FL=1|jgi:membrane protein implicated in regulation of membrane protease activity